MPSHSFGSLFKMTTWGESHGPSIGVVIDGMPAGLEIDLEFIQTRLNMRSAGRNAYVTPRKEADQAVILSGVFEGVSTGAPIAIQIQNQDVKSKTYEAQKKHLRPGHANYSYLKKYGVFDYRGGGRASARETACRVAAGAIAQLLLAHHGIEVFAYLHALGGVQNTLPSSHRCVPERDAISSSPIFCADQALEAEMLAALEIARQDGDSLGGVVEFCAFGLPAGLGDPIYEKLEARLAYAMLSIPATKSFEIGQGFEATRMHGSTHNDQFLSGAVTAETPVTNSNHAGGILGGISTGMPVYGRVGFKPTSTIAKPQNTVDLSGHSVKIDLGTKGRHDPCVAIRGVPVVQAMCALVVADALLANRLAKLNPNSGELNDP